MVKKHIAICIGQKKIFSAKVLVVGAGGLGCPLLLYLANTGVGRIGIIDNDKIEEYVDYLKAQGRSNSTIRKNLAALSKMLHVAHKKNHLMMLPVIERPKEDEAEIRWIGQHDPDEETKIIKLLIYLR